MNRARSFAPRSSRSRLIAVGVVLFLVVGAGASGVTLLGQGRQAQGLVAGMQADLVVLRDQLAAYDLAGAADTMASLRVKADTAHRLTSGPLWGVAGLVPMAGRDVRAARAVTAALAEVLDAAQPLEPLLPRLAPAGGGEQAKIDVGALQEAAQALPALSAAVADAYGRVEPLQAHGLRPELAEGLGELQSGLGSARGWLSSAEEVFAVLPPMLGAGGPRSYVVLLQQDAEARGTGGLVGGLVSLTTDDGVLRLEGAFPRGVVGKTPIPVAGAPEELRQLWGDDLSEWAGLNLSPHFPWTAQLVSQGWAVQHGGKHPDYVAALDQYGVATMLAGTGPVTVQGVTVTSENAVRVLSKDVYARFPDDPADVDMFAVSLVGEVFARFAAGKLDLGNLVSAMGDPVSQRRVLLWAADADVEKVLAGLPVGGVLPDEPGPFAMTVVNNGGGNKLDAYLSVSTEYDPGACTQNVRIGRITTTLRNGAPESGLPSYVTPRSDLRQRGLKSGKSGSNQLIVDLYGPVGASAAMVTLDGAPVAATLGEDRRHPVWRVKLPIDPGQTRVLEATVVDPVTLQSPSLRPVVMTQPMAIPATAAAVALQPCTS